MSTHPGIAPVNVSLFRGSARVEAGDHLAVEEPLEIRLGYDSESGARVHRTVSVTMRTPGHDLELAAGFLFGEGILRERSQLSDLVRCAANVVRVELGPRVSVDLERLERNFYTTSSCGVCGKTSLEAVRVRGAFGASGLGPRGVDPALVHALPQKLRAAQSAFETTGGVHATGVFDAEGELLTLREDVGRHNAFDKVVGEAFLRGALPLSNQLVLVSGRASFELLQKAAMAGLTVFAAVGAPSSLALELARESGITLLGFVRDDRFNVYSGGWRLAGGTTQ
jgi:FdhD protein